MGILSKLFKKKHDDGNIRKRPNQPDVMNVQKEDENMNWAIEKSKLTLHYFKKCLQNPKPEQVGFSIKVKISDGEKVEHIWLVEPSFDDEGNLFGVVNNVPIDVRNVKMDQRIGIDENLVSDWMIVENDRLIGGYTIRAIRDKLSGMDLINFDKGLGGLIVDAGEDFFLPEDSTPEGAIVKIELAYNENRVDKIIECKDFNKEAELMLLKMGKVEKITELVEKTTEVLKLSFIRSLRENGIPKFNNLKQAFPKREKINDDQMIVTEVLYFPDGSTSIQRINTFKSDNGWKVLHPED